MTALQRPTRGLQASLTIAFLMALGSGIAVAQDPAEEVVAIVNEANPETTMSIQRLRLVYALYQRSWPGGIRVQVLLPTEESRAMEFLVSKVFRKGYAADVDRYYLQAVVQQRIPKRPPRLSAGAAIATVRSDPGAIALVERGEVADGSALRILPIVEE